VALAVIATFAVANPVAIPAAGAIARHGASPATTPASCSDVNPIGIGAAATDGSITSAGQADCYTFSAKAGERVIVRVVVTGGSLVPETEIDNPKAATVCGPSTQFEQNCRLLLAGVSTILIRDQSGTSTGTYTVYAQLSVPVGCTAIKFGKALTRSITAEGNTDCYKFPAAAGDHIRFAIAATSGSLQTSTEVLGPTGNAFCGPSNNLEQSCRPTQTGSQTILVADLDGRNTGGYTIYVQKLNGPLGCNPIPFQRRPLTKGSISFPGAENCYVFNGTGNDGAHLQVLATGGTLMPYIEMVKPDGLTLSGPTTATDLRSFLPVTGQYMILIRDVNAINTGTYTAYVIERTIP
jgi:hypothetical protein